MGLLEEINWYVNGESSDESIFNRPLKELVKAIDDNTFNPLIKTIGINIGTDSVGIVDNAVVPGDFVYKNIDGIFYRTMGNDTSSERAIGVYTISNGNPSILVSGIYKTTGLIIGETYFIDSSVSGIITNVEYYGATKVGTALTSEVLLVNISIPPKLSKRLDKVFEEFDITEIIYDTNGNILNITYNTGNKEIWSRSSGKIDKVDYLDVDGITVLSSNTYTYDAENRLITTTWS